MRFQIQIIVACYAALLLIFLLSKKDKKKHNQVFSFFIGAILLNLGFEILNELKVLTDTISFNSFIGFLYGPILWIYVQSIVKKSIPKATKYYLHFIPSIIILVLESTFYLGSFHQAFPLWKIIASVMVLHAFIYAIRISNWTKKMKGNKKARPVLNWLKILSRGFFMLLLLYSLEVGAVLMDNFDLFFVLNIISLILLALIMNVMVYYGLANPKIFNDSIKYRYSKLSNSCKEEFILKIEAHLKNKEPFLDPELTLKLLANQLAIRSSHLSQIINEHYQQSFKDFINSYRITKAKALLKVHPDMYTKEVMYESGFHSKSTFHYVFKKHTGMSPSEFRESIIKKEKESSKVF